MAKTLTEYATRLTGTKNRPNNQRLQVDSGQTSFEENLQFKFYDEYHENSTQSPISNSDIVVYKVTTVNPINILGITLELWAGSRTVQLYEDVGVTFGGSLVDQSSKISHENRNKNEYIDTLPTTATVISRYIGSDTFTSSKQPTDGFGIKTAGNSNQQVSAFSQSGERLGLPDNTSIYIVLTNISGNDDSSGILKIVYEELQ